MTALRVGIVGARRAAQGIGAFVARDFARLGADVVAIVGTRAETVAAAAAELKRAFALDVHTYTSFADMLRCEALDAVAICSPQQFHREQLELALENRLHVLCEKPLVFTPGRDNGGDVRPLVEAFAAAGRVLMVNQQWPYTLSGFKHCYPDILSRPIMNLETLLAPAEDGLAMIPNSLPHVLSLLLSLVPTGGRLEEIRVHRSAERMELAFQYVHTAGRVSVRSHLVQVSQQPRPAGYAINGCAVRRTIRMADYAMFLEPVADSPLVEITASPGPATGVTLEDPLRLLLADFISRTRAARGPQAVDPALGDNVRLLDQLYREAEEQTRGAVPRR